MSSSSLSSVPRYGVPVMQQVHPASVQSFNLDNGNFNDIMVPQETEGKMMKRLQELEKQLLLDDEDGENDVYGVANSVWSETIKNILGSTPVPKPENTVSPSPTSSSSSSCASSFASPTTPIFPKQLLYDSAIAIADGKSDSTVEILTRLNQYSNALGTPDQRLSFYMASTLQSRLNVNPTTVSELYGKDHIMSTQLLYDKSPCFKLALMAANATILELGEAGKNIHVVDFDIGQRRKTRGAELLV
ncbi:hypothetical protein L1887_18820 [Cichorium endivia]|nr:hypothetical protein L1887_18820 [Cichorium endivia]